MKVSLCELEIAVTSGQKRDRQWRVEVSGDTGQVGICIL